MPGNIASIIAKNARPQARRQSGEGGLITRSALPTGLELGRLHLARCALSFSARRFRTSLIVPAPPLLGGARHVQPVHLFSV